MDEPGAKTNPILDKNSLGDSTDKPLANPQAVNVLPALKGASDGPPDTTAFPSQSASASQSDQPTVDIVLYHRRFYLLLLFALNGFIQGAIWNTWGPLTESTNIAFGWDDATIALFSNWGAIAYIVTAPLFPWLMDVKGLRWATLLTITLVTIGSGLRCITPATPAMTWLTHTGQFLNGLGSSVAMAGPPVMSSVWFPVHQRTTATGFSAALNALGVATSFIIGPLIVPQLPICEASLTNTSVVTTQGPDFTEPAAVAANVSCDMTKNKAEITAGIMRLMYIEFAFSAFLFLLILIYFPSRPPKPPSLTAAVKRVEFKVALKELFLHKRFWMMGIPYALSDGIYDAWSSVFAMNVQVIGVNEELAGWLGFWATVAGQVAAVVISIFADVFARRMKLFLLVIYTVASLVLLEFALMCSSIVPYNAVVLWLTMIVSGMCMYGTIPLFLEIVCESTYPIAEGVTTGFLTWVNNVVQLVFLLVVMVPMGTTWMNWCLFGAVLVCTPVFGLYKERYGRLDTDQLGIGRPFIKDIPGPPQDEEDSVQNVSDTDPLIQ